MTKWAFLFLPGAFVAVALLWPVRSVGEDWSDFNGNAMAQKYSTATQITPDNVKNLAIAWSVHTGDVSPGGAGNLPKTAWQSTPLFVNNTVYVSTPFYRIFAIEPDTGKVKWIYAAKTISNDPKAQFHGKNRGIAYWAAASPVAGQPCQKVLYLGTVEGQLHAIDADSGQLCQGFGDHGILNVDQWNTINHKFPFELNQSVSIYKDMLIVGWAGVDWSWQDSPPGSVFGVDARTGEKKWDFQTEPENMRSKIGTTNVWASMSVDAANGLVYLPVSSPENNYWGGDRLQDMPYATSVTALHADTGQVAWVRQLVHHDIWDIDTNAAPTLVDIPKDGQTIPALVQTTKQGFLFVLNRLTGEPVYPIEERSVPKSDAPGEVASLTQPVPTGLEPTTPWNFPGISEIADLASFGQCSKDYAGYRDEGKFTPPSLKGTISETPTTGGMEWGGGAVDPNSQTYVVNSSNVIQVYKLIPRQEFDALYAKIGRAAGSTEYESPFAAHIYTFLNEWGMPCWKPPYGTMSSYDLKTGKLLWRHPFGQVQQWGFYMPESWGSVTIGGPVITKTGLIFIGASMDSRVRALDLKTGEVLWKSLVEAPVVATPAVYTYKGKQYVVFAAGGNGIVAPRVSDQLIAYALPN
ncbi:MAG TPA: pyrroloquinoline quinone-dependent dehydrogenase [Rhizomicrobium sp.]|jgi:quinoprotein glucose dehydrogenase|nr:pyrroloquinoline quinone-dependent dehydrogenase [Rhizomicrobium sp.]